MRNRALSEARMNSASENATFFGCPVRQFNVQLFVEKVFIAQK